MCVAIAFSTLVVTMALPAQAGATKAISECTDQAIRSAVAAGGEYVLQCDTPVALRLLAPLTVNSPVSLDATGHKVFLSNPNGRAFVVSHGSLQLIGISVRGSLVGGSGAAGFNGANGIFWGPGPPLACVPQNRGLAAGPGVDGGSGGSGSGAADGADARGGAIYIASGASVRLYDDQVFGAAQGGDGGSGGDGGIGREGGDGGSVSDTGGGGCNSEFFGGNGGKGGDGGNGASGGDGGDAEGGSVYVEAGGTLNAANTTFEGARAQGGKGGEGGEGGHGGGRGSGGSGSECCPNSAGSPGTYSGTGGRGGKGGDGGSARGGAIYSEGTVNLWDVRFGDPVVGGEMSLAVAGTGGNGGDGGDGGYGFNGPKPWPPVGDGGDAGDGGDGRSAVGGAIYNGGELNVFTAGFLKDQAGDFGLGDGGDGGVGGNSPMSEPSSYEGFPGDGGDAGNGGDVSFASIAGPIARDGCASFIYGKLIDGSAGSRGGGGWQEVSGGLVGAPGSFGSLGAVGPLDPTAGFTSPPCAGMRINEFMLSAGGDPTAQYVELVDDVNEPFSSDAAPYELVVYDAAGVRTGRQVIPLQLLQNRNNTRPLLISTPFADARLGVAGEETLMPTLPQAGQACFVQDGGQEKSSCVAWGCVTSLVSPGASMVAAPPDGESAQSAHSGSNIMSGSAFSIGAPTPGETNTTGVEAPHCPVSGAEASGASGNGLPAPQPSSSAPVVAGRRKSANRQACIAQARRSRRKAIVKAKLLSEGAAQLARQKAAKRYRLAVKRCPSQAR